ncbi:hypothetical protein [uncultured Desulfovibrio sp.]|uniref:hypothetical protein n=1 Tax=uncultured Desulfovibrio sp. TaxID=167968 RepID=UPI00260CC794|nr:hypothetical protein [uncultured Desulfovibrio sp.]
MPLHHTICLAKRACRRASPFPFPAGKIPTGIFFFTRAKRYPFSCEQRPHLLNQAPIAIDSTTLRRFIDASKKDERRTEALENSAIDGDIRRSARRRYAASPPACRPRAGRLTVSGPRKVHDLHNDGYLTLNGMTPSGAAAEVAASFVNGPDAILETSVRAASELPPLRGGDLLRAMPRLRLQNRMGGLLRMEGSFHVRKSGKGFPLLIQCTVPVSAGRAAGVIFVFCYGGRDSVL